MRNTLRQQIVRSGVFSEYLVHQVLRLMIERCEALNLYVRGSRRDLKPHLLWAIARLRSPTKNGSCPGLRCDRGRTSIEGGGAAGRRDVTGAP